VFRRFRRRFPFELAPLIALLRRMRALHGAVIHIVNSNLLGAMSGPLKAVVEYRATDHETINGHEKRDIALNDMPFVPRGESPRGHPPST
jgi:hypothetical protein